MKKPTPIEFFIAILIFGMASVGLFFAGHAYAKDQSIRQDPPVLLLRNGPGPHIDKIEPKATFRTTVPGEDQMFSVFVPTNGPTNITFRAYFGMVSVTNGAPIITTAASVVDSEFFTTNSTNVFQGDMAFPLTPGTWTNIGFSLSETKFQDAPTGDVLLTIIPFVTGGTNQVHQGAAIFPIDSAEDGLQGSNIP